MEKQVYGERKQISEWTWWFEGTSKNDVKWLLIRANFHSELSLEQDAGSWIGV